MIKHDRTWLHALEGQKMVYFILTQHLLLLLLECIV